MKTYRHIATTKAGYIQQIAVAYVRHGYVFFVKGHVPDGKDPRETDQKLMQLYDIRATKDARYRRKKQGLANLQYIRFGQDWVMLATHGKHETFFTREEKNIRDVRKVPLIASGYSITISEGGVLKKTPGTGIRRDPKDRVRIQISKAMFRTLKNELLSHARNRSVEWYRARFYHIGFEPYAPIRKQLLELLRLVNKARATYGLPKIAPDCIRYRRKIVKPFELEREAA